MRIRLRKKAGRCDIIGWLLKDQFYFVLQVIQETAGLHAIHLGMVKLKGDGQSGLKQSFPILPPRKKRVVPTARKLVDNTIQFCVWQC